ncbi:MAG: hypothetical protein CL570_07740 [Alphaproteobacteria bacterium]|nr:hypothetical protein [Alphaproteobacteria bacterium]HCQ71209.1 hypothetical protein [Rhodospirillaceae bacterium]|tara:strand:+ start:36803 stop:37066 length:264 start_codon:yes stop_codon:yes gene_type:complete
MTADVFSDVLELHDAVVLRDVIARGLEENSSYVLDLSEVQRASLSCFQILVSALRECEAADSSALQVSLSASLKDAMIDLGLGQYAE